jgi:hypothetical protein
MGCASAFVGLAAAGLGGALGGLVMGGAIGGAGLIVSRADTSFSRETCRRRFSSGPAGDRRPPAVIFLAR